MKLYFHSSYPDRKFHQYPEQYFTKICVPKICRGSFKLCSLSTRPVCLNLNSIRKMRNWSIFIIVNKLFYIIILPCFAATCAARVIVFARLQFMWHISSCRTVDHLISSSYLASFSDGLTNFLLLLVPQWWSWYYLLHPSSMRCPLLFYWYFFPLSLLEYRKKISFSVLASFIARYACAFRAAIIANLRQGESFASEN